jgi:MFS family permease
MARSETGRGATFAVAVLTAMNLLNYVDRWVPSATKELFKKELDLTDAQTSLPLTAFVFVYMLASPVFGTLSDRWPRRFLIAGGVALWSLATGAAAFATGFLSFLAARALVGIGEAAYATISPSLISDFYPPARRNRILTVFYVAIPVGSAIGFTAGANLGQHFGWRTAFLVCGLPGVLAAGAALFIAEPRRGAFDADPEAPPPAWPEALRSLARNPTFALTTAGYVAVTFASGALADWFPAFLSRYRGMAVGDAGSLIGTAAAVGGLFGTAVGGWLGDRLRGVTRQPYLALSAGSMAITTGLVIAALLVEDHWPVFALMVSAQFFMWFYNGPVNAILVNSVSSGLRARAFSVSILCIHLFGDAISPPLVGEIADLTGSLAFAIGLVPVALVVCTAIWAFAWRRLPEPESEPGPEPAP